MYTYMGYSLRWALKLDHEYPVVTFSWLELMSEASA